MITIDEFMDLLESQSKALHIHWGVDREGIFNPRHSVRTFYRGIKSCPITFLANSIYPYTESDPLPTSQVGESASRLGLWDFSEVIQAIDGTGDNVELRARMLRLVGE